MWQAVVPSSMIWTCVLTLTICPQSSGHFCPPIPELVVTPFTNFLMLFPAQPVKKKISNSFPLKCKL